MNTGQEKREIPAQSLENPISIAVDWIGNNLYVVEQSGNRIDIVSIDGNHQKTVIVDYLSHPTDVVVDPGVGYVSLKIFLFK